MPDEDNVDADDVLRHGAVRLFVVRAQAVEPRYVPDRRVASAAAAICRHLDGIPLAIELAAARIAAFGVEGVASRLGDRFRLLTGGSKSDGADSRLRRISNVRARCGTNSSRSAQSKDAKAWRLAPRVNATAKSPATNATMAYSISSGLR